MVPDPDPDPDPEETVVSCTRAWVQAGNRLQAGGDYRAKLTDESALRLRLFPGVGALGSASGM